MIIVCGGAGFIGVNLVRRLIAAGQRVVVIDAWRMGRRGAPHDLREGESLRLIEADLADADDCARAFALAQSWGEAAQVWHLAANADIPAGVADPSLDLRDTFLTTFEILRQMRARRMARLVFASSSAIYGDLQDRALSEETGPLLPISNYGAMKLASEGQVAAAAEAFLDQAVILRFPNVIGAPATHGVILDFIRRLGVDGSELRVLGDGTQRKPYLHVDELIDAMLAACAAADRGVSLYNIGPDDEGVTVRWIAEQVVARVRPGASIAYGRTPKGWVGDVSRFRYDIGRIKAAGWTPRLTSAQAVRRAIDEIAGQEGA